MEDDDGFAYYEETTVDPGYMLFLLTTLFCIVTNMMLPCFVSLGRRRDKRRLWVKEQREEEKEPSLRAKESSKGGEALESGSAISSQDRSSFYPKGYSNKKNEDENHAPSDLSENYPDAKRPEQNQPSNLQDWLQPFDGRWFYGSQDKKNESGSTLSGRRSNLSARRSNITALRSTLSARSSLTYRSSASNATTSILDTGWGATGRKAVVGTRRRAKGLGGAERRRLQEQQRLESMKVMAANNNEPPQDAVTGVVLDGDEMSKVDDQDILPNDAPDSDVKADMTKEINQDYYDVSCCGESAWWRPATLARYFDGLLIVAEWDNESRRITKLAIPYSFVSVMEGLFDVVTIGLISHYIGTDAVAAYAVVNLIVGLTSEFVGGISEAAGVLCPHAIGARNYKLAGQYIQISAIMFTLMMIPFLFLWAFVTESVFGWLGFNEEVAKLGQQYAIVFMFGEWVEGVHECYLTLLNVIEYERWATAIDIVEGIVGVVIITIMVVTDDSTTLIDVGIIHVACGIAFMLFDVAFTVYKGWVRRYFEGMMGSLALRNRSAVALMAKTAIPLSIGSLIAYGEFEVLTIFAAALGPAEVTAWGLVGSLWETIEATTIGMADAGEVRCAYHLGGGRPAKARQSAYKSVYIGNFMAMFVTSVVFMLGENIAMWFTPDPTLQRMIVDILPLIGVGNITLTAGSVCWALVGAQGRYRLATFIWFLTSWGVTMPLAAMFTYGFHINLQGLAAAVVIGYSLTGTALSYVLIRSDWELYSKLIMELNALEDEEEEEAADSSSTSSSPSD